MAGLAILLCVAAQDFGVEWLDRVTHDREQARYPLAVRPVDTQLQVGALYAYDTNVFLEPDDERAANIAIPFIRGRLDYAAPRWDAAADVLLDYKQYFQQRDESGDDERVY